MRSLRSLRARLRLIRGDHRASHLYGWHWPLRLERIDGVLEHPVRWLLVSVGPWWWAIGLERRHP